MSRITVRCGPEVEAALSVLTADGTSRSQAARAAVLFAARKRMRTALAAEVKVLTSDPDDVAAVRSAREDLEQLRTW